MTIRLPLVLAFALALCTVASAQENPWPAVQALSPGVSLQVHLLSGKTVKGKLAAVTPAGLDLRTSRDSTRYIARARISSVYLTKKSSVTYDASLGAGIGAGAGLAAGALLCTQNQRAEICASGGSFTGALFGGAALAAVGAAIGAIRGLVHHPKTLIYKRRPRQSHSGRKSPHQQKSALTPFSTSPQPMVRLRLTRPPQHAAAAGRPNLRQNLHPAS